MKEGKLSIIIYTAIITTLVIAIGALVYYEFFYNAEKLKEINAELRSVEFQLKVSRIERKKILRTQELDIDLAELRKDHYGLGKESVTDVEEEINEKKADLDKKIAGLEKEKKKLEDKKKELEKET